MHFEIDMVDSMPVLLKSNCDTEWSMSRCKSRPVHRGAFSLLELLVVIFIVTLLVAVALPTFGRVREAARRATDISNLRQLTGACLCYAQANDRKLPSGRMASAPVGADDYTWTNYATCWKPLLNISGTFATMSSCISVREGNTESNEFGQPQYDYANPNDVKLGWIYWGGSRRSDSRRIAQVPKHASS